MQRRGREFDPPLEYFDFSLCIKKKKEMDRVSGGKKRKSLKKSVKGGLKGGADNALTLLGNAALGSVNTVAQAGLTLTNGAFNAVTNPFGLVVMEPSQAASAFTTNNGFGLYGTPAPYSYDLMNATSTTSEFLPLSLPTAQENVPGLTATDSGVIADPVSAAVALVGDVVESGVALISNAANAVARVGGNVVESGLSLVSNDATIVSRVGDVVQPSVPEAASDLVDSIGIGAVGTVALALAARGKQREREREREQRKNVSPIRRRIVNPLERAQRRADMQSQTQTSLVNPFINAVQAPAPVVIQPTPPFVSPQSTLNPLINALNAVSPLQQKQSPLMDALQSVQTKSWQRRYPIMSPRPRQQRRRSRSRSKKASKKRSRSKKSRASKKRR